MIYSDWTTFWRDQNRILEIFFDFLIVEKGLSQNTIFSYKRDFKLLCMYLFDSNWFKKNVSPKRKKNLYESINKESSKKKLTYIRKINHNFLIYFFFSIRKEWFQKYFKSKISFYFETIL
ncbi:MAG: site-specific integrase [Pseudomonadota bacterium]|nr:site-specific integrase [Pseudomonadota bacterium]